MSVLSLTRVTKNIRTTSQKTTYLQYVHGCYSLLSLFPFPIQKPYLIGKKDKWTFMYLNI